MTVITLFEHQQRSYAALSWLADSPVLAQLEQLNAATGAELVRFGRRPFAKLETGRTAVRVIDRYADEVLRVYQV